MEALLFEPGHFTRLFQYPLVRGYVGPGSFWAAWKGENILPVPEIESRFIDSPAAHDLSLQLLLTGG